MSRYGPADADITFNSQAIADATVIGDLETEALLEEITPIGSAWETHGAVGVKKMAPLTIEAPYSDDSNLLRDEVESVGVGGTATLLVAYGGSKTTSVSTIVQKIKRAVKRGSLTMFVATLQPTGTVTEA